MIGFTGLASVFGLLSMHLKTMRTERDAYMVSAATSQEQLKFASQANASLNQQIDKLQEERRQDWAAQELLAKSLSNIDQRFANQSKLLNDLKRQNETVRNYLDSPVPDELRKLATQPATGSAANKSGKSATSGKPNAKATGSGRKAASDHK